MTTPYDTRIEALGERLRTPGASNKDLVFLDLTTLRAERSGYLDAVERYQPLVVAAQTAVDGLDRAADAQDRSVGIIKQVCLLHSDRLRAALKAVEEA